MFDLITDRASVNRLIGAVVLEDDSPSVASTFEVSIDCDYPDVAIEVLKEYSNRFWRINGLTSRDNPMYKYFRNNSLGGINDTLRHEIMLEVWQRQMATHGLNSEVRVTIVPRSETKILDTDGVIDVMIAGKVKSIKIDSFTKGEQYRDDCTSCQQSMQFIRELFLLLNGKIFQGHVCNEWDGSFENLYNPCDPQDIQKIIERQAPTLLTAGYIEGMIITEVSESFRI